MDWQRILRTLERDKEWDTAIEFMQEVVRNDPDSMDAYIAMNYLLMNLLVEEDYDKSKHNYYEMLTKKYFDESYQKFSNNPEYLYYTGRTAAMSEWFFGIDIEEAEAMIERSLVLDPNNLIYQWIHYGPLGRKNPDNSSVIAYAEKVLDKDSFIQKTLQQKGAIGDCLLGMMTNWASKVITKYPYR